MAKVSKQIQQLFLRLLNFEPALLAKTQQEANLQNTTFDALIRVAVQKHLQDLAVAREQQDPELRQYARLLLKAHFADDRNEFLTGEDIRKFAGEDPPVIGETKPQ
jgi:hypothetical protein